MSELPGNNVASATARRPGWAAWLLIAPLLLWLAGFVLAPNLILLIYSFCQRDDLTGQVVYSAHDPDTGRLTAFDNYRRILDPGYDDPTRTGPPVYVVLAARSARSGGIVGVAGAAVALTLAIARPGRPAWRFVLRWVVLGFVIGFLWRLNNEIERPDNPLFALGGNDLRTLWRSVKYAGWTTTICLLAGYPVGYVIGRAGEPARTRLLLAVMVPFWTSFLIRTYAWIRILSHDGLLNGLLRATHLAGPLAALGVGGPDGLDLMYTPTAVLIGMVYAYLPFMILPVYASAERLDGALIDAALDLGAGPLRAFRDVIWPLTTPGVAAGCLLVFVPAVGTFAIPDLMGGARVPLVGNVIQNQFLKARDWPFGSALGIVLMALFCAALWLVSRRRATSELMG